MGASSLAAAVLVPLSILLVASTSQGGATPAEAPLLVRWNDNAEPGGRLGNGTYTLDLEVVNAEWRFLGEKSAGVEILAFREAGGPPLNPGPMIRVPLGTAVTVSVRNPLDRPLVVHGLSSRWQAVLDSLVVPAGEVRTARFTADVPGTFHYWGTTTGAGISDARFEDSQLNGAFIVDAPGEARRDERVLVMSLYFAGRDSDGDPDFALETFAINGRPWPHTERIEYTVGDTAHWRVINLTERGHPMHLHGFYFQVLSAGDGHRDVPRWPSERRLVVTEGMDAGGTMRMSWVAERPGGWLFHCHLGFHVLPNAAPGEYQSGKARYDAAMGAHDHGDPNNHVVRGMGGLMMAVEVQPRTGEVASQTIRDHTRLHVRSDSIAGKRRLFDFALGEAGGAGSATPTGPIRWPGPVLLAWRGVPTAVTVINHSPEATQVHWHGLEVDSYFDGGVGVSGSPGMRTPAIVPGDSFQMRITPPRAGTFIYHTHMHDLRQQSAGLYGAFVVLEPGSRWDPTRDHVHMLSTGPEGQPLLDGSGAVDTVEWRSGEVHRLRLINITFANPASRFMILGPRGYAVRWRQVAEDGADLPRNQATLATADVNINIGKTMDFEFEPQEPGEYRLEVRSGGGRLFGRQVIRVAPRE
jgi:manganese oxidase